MRWSVEEQKQNKQKIKTVIGPQKTRGNNDNVTFVQGRNKNKYEYMFCLYTKGVSYQSTGETDDIKQKCATDINIYRDTNRPT